MRRRDSRFSILCLLFGHRFPGGPVPDDGPEQVEAMSIPCARCGNDRIAATFSPDTLPHWLWNARMEIASARLWARRRFGVPKSAGKPPEIP